MIFELSMPVHIYRGEEFLAVGELLPNGNEMALCVDGGNGDGFALLDYSCDTESVEEKIPLKIFQEGEEVAEGELFQSGSNICVCPYTDTSFNLMDPKSEAKLSLSPDGWGAVLEVSRAH